MNVYPFKIQKDDADQPDYFDFTRIQNRISEAFFYQEMLRYLVNIRAEFIQKKLNDPNIKHSANFNELIDSEITRVKMLMDIEKYYKEIDLIEEQIGKIHRDDLNRSIERGKLISTPTDKKSIRQLKHKDLTLDRATLFFKYLFDYAKSNCSKADKARVVAFLTNFDNEKIRQQLSGTNKKAYSNFVNFENDMNTVIGLFEMLGLPEIAKAIKNDLKQMETETESEFL